jgi:hypothetical protein
MPNQKIVSRYAYLIVLVPFLVIAIIWWWQSQYITYLIDEANECKNGITTNVAGPTHLVRMKRSEARDFMQQAKLNNQCIYQQ